MKRKRNNSKVRRGLAPLEFVLALPILLFVMALIVNYGTVAAWRVRGEIASRDAVWGQRYPRSAQTRPPSWPDDAAYRVAADSQIALLDDPEIDHEVVRGPLGPITVKPLLDPDRTGAKQGITEIDRPFALLPTTGDYESGDIHQRMLEPMWQCDDEGYRNWIRRSRILYVWPETGLEGAFESAGQSLRSHVQSNWDALRVLEDDIDFMRYRGNGPDFHPRPRHRCETNPNVVRDDSVENYLIDYLDARREVQLGRITRLPRTMTGAFLSLYRRRKQYLEDLIEQLQTAMPPPPDAAAQIAAAQAEIDNELNPKIEQLEAYQRRLPEIEDDLRRNSTAM